MFKINSFSRIRCFGALLTPLSPLRNYTCYCYPPNSPPPPPPHIPAASKDLNISRYRISTSAAMVLSAQTIHNSGIHYNLPTFPAHDGKKYTAIVTGANGISGSEIVNALVAAPERWEVIYAMSRRPPPSHNDRVKSIAADFLSSSPEDLVVLFEEEGVKA